MCFFLLGMAGQERNFCNCFVRNFVIICNFPIDETQKMRYNTAMKQLLMRLVSLRGAADFSKCISNYPLGGKKT